MADFFSALFGDPRDNGYLSKGGSEYTGAADNPLKFNQEQRMYIDSIFANQNTVADEENAYVKSLRTRADIGDNVSKLGNVAIIAGAIVVYFLLK
jgi:hypothetical protein